MPCATMIRGFLHIDLDAFFVSVEQVLHAELRGKPVIVGGRPERRGVVASASYEARAFGIHAAMPLARAYQLCPQAIFLQGSYARYAEFSDRFMSILSDFSPSLEPGGLDEACLDITGCDIFGTPHEIAVKIKQRVKSELGLIASAGIASCRIVAKIASDCGKPDGLVEIAPGEEARFLAPLPVGKMPGIGPKTEVKLKSLGIKTLGQVASLPVSVLKNHFGSYGMVLHNHASGVDYSRIEMPDEANSISRETTFGHDITDIKHLAAVLRYLSEKVGSQLRGSSREAKRVTLKLRFADFETINRSRSAALAFSTDDAIYGLAVGLLHKASGIRGKPVRLIGVEVSNLSGEIRQMGMFDAQKLRQERRDQAVDQIRRKYGFDSVRSGQTMALKQIFED
jgi:DNA polymerase-4